MELRVINFKPCFTHQTDRRECRHLVLFAITLQCAAPLCASEPPEERVRAATSFCDLLLNREITLNTEAFDFEGRDSFSTREMKKGKSSGKEVDVCAVRADRKVCTLEQRLIEPRPETIKVMATEDRCLNVISNTASTLKHKSCNESLILDAVRLHASNGGQGVCFGYFYQTALPEFSRIRPTVSWELTDSGKRIVGNYEGWRFTFVFEATDSVDPLRIEIDNSTIAGADSSGPLGRTIEFNEWTETDGIHYPSQIVGWELFRGKDGRLSTYASRISVTHVGQPIEIGDSYKSFFKDIENETPVAVHDYRGIDFVWKDGEIVRKIDETKLNTLHGRSFFESPFRRYVYMCNGAVFVAIISYLIWRRNRTEKA